MGTALDKLGVSRVTVIGHSGGCTVATALAEQRPGTVAALRSSTWAPPGTLRSLESLASTCLLLTQFPGPLLWRLKTEATIRKVEPASPVQSTSLDALIEGLLGMTYRAFAGRCARSWTTSGSGAFPIG